MRLVPFAATVIACLSAPVLAQTPDTNAPPVAQAPQSLPSAPANPPEAVPPPARFSFSRVEMGLLRLDTQTGQVAMCSAHTVGWACEAVPEDRAALKKEIARLQEEVGELKRQISELQPQPPPRPPALVPDTGDKTVQLLTDEDIARARAYVEEAWRRLVEMLISFQKDVMRKT